MKKLITLLIVLFSLLAFFAKGQGVHNDKEEEKLTGVPDTLINDSLSTPDSIKILLTIGSSALSSIIPPVTNYRDSIFKIMVGSDLTIRGLYVPGRVIINRTKIDKLMAFMTKNNFNNLIFDLKMPGVSYFIHHQMKWHLKYTARLLPAKEGQGILT